MSTGIHFPVDFLFCRQNLSWYNNQHIFLMSLIYSPNPSLQLLLLSHCERFLFPPQKYFQLRCDNNLMAKSRILLLCIPQARRRAPQHRAMIEESRNSNERGDGVTQMCCCSQRAACIETENAQTCTAARNALDPVHRQQRRSIIPVEHQSIYCWLTGIQSPFPKGVGIKERHTACGETHSHTRLMGQVLDWFMRHPVL